MLRLFMPALTTSANTGDGNVSHKFESVALLQQSFQTIPQKVPTLLGIQKLCKLLV